MNTRKYTPFAAAVLLSSGLLLAQGTVPPALQDQKAAPEVNVTGCLIQGSGPTVFLLDNARLTTEDTKIPGKTYVLTGAGEDMDFRKDLSHEVTVTGTIEMKIGAVPPAGQKVAEKDLPKLAAKTVTMLTDKCSAIPR